MKKTVKFAGFTLIELLIVIGLIAALASILLPSLMGSREDALEGICSYNQAGTLRTLRQYQAMTGNLPDGFHSGLKIDEDSGAALNEPMAGMPPALIKVLAEATASNPTAGIVQLTAAEANSLKAAGINYLAYGNGKSNPTNSIESMGYIATALGSYVISIGNGCHNEGDPDQKLYTFNGKTIDSYLDEGFSNVIALFLTSTVSWEAPSTSWVKGFTLKMEVPGTCPIPQTDFAYYVAYVGVKGEGYKITYALPAGATLTIPSTFKKFVKGSNAPAATDVIPSGDADWTPGTDSDSSDKSFPIIYKEGEADEATVTVSYEHVDYDKAELLGTSCPECGITNP
jgi:prepilin-type N-terminal cleavage/methylation domain-containing protein